MSFEILVIIFFVFLGIAFLNSKNKKEQTKNTKKMLEKRELSAALNTINKSQYSEHEISKLLIKLLEDFNSHSDIGPKLNEDEITEIEKSLNFTFIIQTFFKVFW